MKEYLFLNKEIDNRYYPTKNNMTSNLWDLNNYYFNDCKYFDNSLFINDQSHYNETIIVNDLKNKNLYITTKDFEIEKHIPDDERLERTNEFNSCKISYDNFIEFRAKWLTIKKALPPFAIIYRDDNDWVHCKGFDSQEEMELFVKNYQGKIIH